MHPSLKRHLSVLSLSDVLYIYDLLDGRRLCIQFRLSLLTILQTVRERIKENTKVWADPLRHTIKRRGSRQPSRFEFSSRSVESNGWRLDVIVLILIPHIGVILTCLTSIYPIDRLKIVLTKTELAT